MTSKFSSMTFLRKIVSVLLFVAVAALTSWCVSRPSSREQNSPLGLVTESAQTRFISYATQIAPLRRLELAKVNQVELFERKSEARLLWTRLKLPDVVVSASVPVEYRYYVELNADWQIDLTDELLTIRAPALQPGTPAANVSELRFEIKKGSLFRNEQDVTQSLQAQLTDLLQQRAHQTKSLARETARKELEAVARSWLKQEQKDLPVQILFADEPEDARAGGADRDDDRNAGSAVDPNI